MPISGGVIVGRDFAVCRIARTVAKAVELANRHKPDLAIIDVRIAGGEGTEIAALLTDEVGILYASGNGDPVRLAAAGGIGHICKPYSITDIVPALRIVERVFKTGEALPPYPPCFTLCSKPCLIVRIVYIPCSVSAPAAALPGIVAVVLTGCLP